MTLQGFFERYGKDASMKIWADDQSKAPSSHPRAPFDSRTLSHTYDAYDTYDTHNTYVTYVTYMAYMTYVTYVTYVTSTLAPSHSS